MKLDLEYVRKVSDHLHQLYCEAGGYNPEEHVFSLHFEPDNNHVSCHVSWSYFHNLVAGEVNVRRAGTALHLTASVQGVTVTACVFRHEIVNMLAELGHEVHKSTDIVTLFNVWQTLAGWNVSLEVENDG